MRMALVAWALVLAATQPPASCGPYLLALLAVVRVVGRLAVLVACAPAACGGSVLAMQFEKLFLGADAEGRCCIAGGHRLLNGLRPSSLCCRFDQPSFSNFFPTLIQVRSANQFAQKIVRLISDYSDFCRSSSFK